MGLKKLIKGIGGPLIGLAGDILGGHSAKKAQEKANEQNIALQRENQGWEERMSSTSYQRGTQDMLAAGLNPMLAYSQGGASTPGSSAATVQPVDAGAKAITSSTQNFLARQQAEANIELTRASASKARSEAQVSAASVDSDISQRAMQNDKIHAEVENLWAQRDLTSQQKQQLQDMLPYLQRQIESQITLQKAQGNSAYASSRQSDSTAALNTVRKMAETLGLSQAQAESTYYEALGGGAKPVGGAAEFAGKVIQTLIQIMGNRK
ncbi:DNA pilot protein [Blackfly microvirus SF02]|uniref:DNA pilot protein n=1 Tax=Blackfly microvirus SF02 TaxID=2576452 RepID=A0A4P8PJL1_9VIRU|nr:DNA pilot protein [Blackfly microvirus SF02]